MKSFRTVNDKETLGEEIMKKVMSVGSETCGQKRNVEKSPQTCQTPRTNGKFGFAKVSKRLLSGGTNTKKHVEGDQKVKQRKSPPIKVRCPTGPTTSVLMT